MSDTTSSISLKLGRPAGRIIPILTILLVAQLAAAVLLKVCAPQYQPVEAGASLLACDFDKIDKIVIAAGSASKSNVVMEKTNAGWTLPEYYGFRASPEAIAQLFNSLKTQKRGFPAGTTTEAADRFKVSATSFDRAIHLYAGHLPPTTLYLGSSPSFHNIYARPADSKDVYTIEMNRYQLSDQPDAWIDKSAACLKPIDIDSLEINGCKLQKVNNRWTLSTGGKSVVVDDPAAHNLLASVSDVSINSVLGTKDEPDYDLQHPVVKYNVTMKNGTSADFVFSKPKNHSYHVLKMSNESWYAGVDDWIVNKLKAINPTALLKGRAATKEQMAPRSAGK